MILEFIMKIFDSFQKKLVNNEIDRSTITFVGLLPRLTSKTSNW